MKETNLILNEIKKALGKVKESKDKNIVEEIAKAREINLVGAGRSWHVAKMFSQRLTHLGLKVGRLGKMPGKNSNKDLTIVISGSGETEDVLKIVKKIKKGKILCITSAKESHIAKHSDYVIEIKAKKSRQPLRSLFEQSTLLYLDSIVMKLMKKLNINENQMWERHK